MEKNCNFKSMLRDEPDEQYVYEPMDKERGRAVPKLSA